MLTFLDRLLPLMARLSKRVDLAAPVFVLIVMVVMILPLPAFIIDILIVFNITMSLVILMVGMEARDDSAEVARLVNISRDKDGWFIESHPKLDPVATTTEGVYIAGCCQSPKDINESVAQARAAAARILGKIAKGRLEVDAVYAEVNEEDCSGCRVCNDLCPYSAIDFDPETKRSSIVSAKCKACGACVTACPSAAITARHFTDEQIFAQIEGVL